MLPSQGCWAHSQKEIGNLNSLISIKEIEFLLKPSHRENSRLYGFTMHFMKHLREE